jgi:hypothetical protein
MRDHSRIPGKKYKNAEVEKKEPKINNYTLKR